MTAICDEKIFVENIPARLQSLPRWVGWRYGIPSDGKPSKVPFSVQTGTAADVTNPPDWSDFQTALDAIDSYDGLGFCLNGDGIIGITLDHCLTLNDEGRYDTEEWVMEALDAVDSYWEFSRSGKGLTGFVEGKIPNDGARKAGIEIYGSNRFFSVTGHRIDGTPDDIQHDQAGLDFLSPFVFDPVIVLNTTVNAQCLTKEATDKQSKSGEAADQLRKKADHWPCLDSAAYHGVMGQIVKTIEPHSEADPVAVLIQLLAMFGNIVERCPHYQIERDTHHTNLFTVLVGETAKGRKGVSGGHARSVFRSIDEDWISQRMQSGLSSGEGLIWAVRDGEIEDKRLFIMESEFASVLRVIGRDGNTLSPVVRDAWDSGNLRTLTKNSAASASGAHISIVGHITRDELRRYLSSTEVANGFANRFLWTCVRRSKCLPFGGSLDESRLKTLVERLQKAVTFARNAGRVQFEHDARELWEKVYPALSDGKPGLLGAVTSRAEAQVARLAMVYALLDCSVEIRLQHLNAALAMWNYCEQSARYIFGDALGDPTVDQILAALRANPEGMTRTHISNLFQRNRKAGEIGWALAILARGGLIRSEQVKTGGRDSEVWKAV